MVARPRWGPQTPMRTIDPLCTLCLALGLTAVLGCSSDDELDGGPRGLDTGAGDFDAGFEPDLGFYDGGRPDVGPIPDAGSLCTINGTTLVDGISVPLSNPRGPPENRNGNPSITRCIGRPFVDTTNFVNSYCPVECIDTFGIPLTPEIVDALEIAVFTEELEGNRVDPMFDVDTGVDRQPEARLPIGFRIVATSPQTCPSGYQLELGFSDLGAEPLVTKVRYIVRVRSTSAAVDWPTTYHWGFVRRNDAVPVVSQCGAHTLRSPGVQLAFPIVPPELIRDGASLATGVVGTDSFTDGRGMGYAMIETRDCDRNGSLMARATAGFSPAPAGTFYVGITGVLAPAATETSVRGTMVGVGFPGNTETSTATRSTAAAVGVSVNGQCTEAFAGDSIPIYPDGVTYFRTGREVTLP